MRLLSKCVGHRNTRTEMYAGRVACYRLVSHVKYALRAVLMFKKRQTGYSRQSPPLSTVTITSFAEARTNRPERHTVAETIPAFVTDRRRPGARAALRRRSRAACPSDRVYCYRPDPGRFAAAGVGSGRDQCELSADMFPSTHNS